MTQKPVIKTFLTSANIEGINQKLKGWNVISDDGALFLCLINGLIKKDVWTANDIQNINQLIRDGCKPALDYIFLELNEHSAYLATYGSIKSRDIPVSLEKVIETEKR